MAHATELNTILSSALNISMISTVQSMRLYKSEEFLRDSYFEKGLSIRQIAAESSSARETIKQALMRLGIQLKSTDEVNRSNYGQIAYGMRILNGQPIQNKCEVQVLKKILHMRTSGMSYCSIANWLNAQNYPTKNKAPSWSAVTIYKIAKRANATY